MIKRTLQRKFSGYLEKGLHWFTFKRHFIHELFIKTNNVIEGLHWAYKIFTCIYSDMERIFLQYNCHTDGNSAISLYCKEKTRKIQSLWCFTMNLSISTVEAILYSMEIWLFHLGKVFKKGPSKICGRQPLKNIA